MTDLHVSIRGPEQADTVLFLHAAGFGGSMWRDVVERLPEMRAIVPDLPGHGASFAEPFVSFEAAADALAGLIARQAGGGPVHVVGVSLGAYVGFRLIERHAGLVASAMLSGFHVKPMARPRLMKFHGDLLSPLAATAWFQRKMARSMGVPEERLQLDGEGSRVSARALRLINRAAVDFKAPDDLARIATPVLAVAGAREHALILNSLTILEGAMPNCVARVAQGLGHAWCAQDPELFADAVRAWVRRESLPDGLEPALLSAA